MLRNLSSTCMLKLGLTGTDLARKMGLTQPVTSMAVKQGEKTNRQPERTL